MAIQYSAVLITAVVAMVLGAIWYGPLFQKKWMEVIGATKQDEQQRKEMQKKAAPLYAIQFVLVLFQMYVLAHYIAGWTEASGVENAVWIWAAFVMPTVAAASMWTNDSSRIKWTRFLIQAGYQLIVFVIAGAILAAW